MSSEQKKIIVSPLAYIKSLMYFQRFSSEFIEEKQFKLAYGILLGFVDVDNTIYIDDFVPLKAFDREFLRFNTHEKIFEIIEKINKEHYDEEFPEYVIGWARNCINGSLETSVIDKKNHLLFQNLQTNALFWIFDFGNLSIDSGFKLFSFKDDFKECNISSELYELNFEFSKNINIDDLVKVAIEIEEKRKTREQLLRGLEE